MVFFTLINKSHKKYPEVCKDKKLRPTLYYNPVGNPHHIRIGMAR